MTGIIAQNVGRTSGLIKAASGGGGVWTKIKEITASSDSDISFVDGTSDVVLDSTYPIYLFKFINIHPATDQAHFQVNFRDGSTAYDATKTTTNFQAYHNEDDSTGVLGYEVAEDLAQSTGVQEIATYQGSDSDQALCGYLHLFDPSSTTFVKHFLVRISTVQYNDRLKDVYAAGYCNVTAAIDGVQFTFSSGNIDAGKIKLYGLKDSA
jgi:hypothetical protein